MTVFEKLLFNLRIGNHKFDSGIWKKSRRKRKLFVKNIIRSRIALGMNKEQLSQVFGFDRREYAKNVWRYTVSTFRDGEPKDMLCFYFNKDDKVKGFRTRYRKMR